MTPVLLPLLLSRMSRLRRKLPYSYNWKLKQCDSSVLTLKLFSLAFSSSNSLFPSPTTSSTSKMPTEKLDRVLVYLLPFQRENAVEGGMNSEMSAITPRSLEDFWSSRLASFVIGDFGESVVSFVKEMDEKNPGHDSGLVVKKNSESGSNSVWVSWRLRDQKLMIGLAMEADAEGGSYRFPVDQNAKRKNSLHGTEKCLLTRPSFCPITNLSEEARADLPHDVLERGIATGVAVLIEVEGKVLLTRRAEHLRTFPHVWVPPGGHIEVGESVLEAGLREVREETGLELVSQSSLSSNRDSIAISSFSCLGLWESVFPPVLTQGSPNRHHIVIYLCVSVSGMSIEEMEERIKLDPAETDAALWIDPGIASGVVSSMEGVDLSLIRNNDQPPNVVSLKSSPPHSVEIIQLTRPSTSTATSSPESNRLNDSSYEVYTAQDRLSQEWIQRKSMLKTSTLFNVAPQDGGSDIERVSTGTKYALALWLSKCR